MSEMKFIYYTVLAAMQVVSCVTLQLISPPPDLNVGLYDAPASYRESGKPPLNTIIIKSKPYNVSDTSKKQNGTTKWRRNLYVETESDEREDEKSELIQPTLLCVDEESCIETTPAPTFKPYSQEELDKFLNSYVALHGKPPSVDDDTVEEPSNKLANLYMENEAVNILETKPKTTEKDKSKSASWQLVQSQTHNHPYDDHKGWVTLEPIPWSASQIQKWEPNPNSRPQIPSWDYKPDHYQHSPQHEYKPPHYSTERPWNKPTYEYKPHRPSYDQHWSENPKPDWHQNEDHPPSHWGGNPDIITDNRPGGNFPSDHHGHRPSWHDQNEYSSTSRPSQGFYNYPEYPSARPSGPNGPNEGNGKWVLLSSTKGYSVPPRRHGYQRSLTFDTKVPDVSMSSHRTVRLTVLPALPNTTNTTTSHGGLLEVESTFQTVDEAQREHAARMMKFESKQKNDTIPKAEALKKDKKKSNEIRVLTRNPANKRAAIIAAVGAGMIPATMAMLLPMVLGRRRRNTELIEERDKVNSTRRIIHKQKLLFSDS